MIPTFREYFVHGPEIVPSAFLSVRQLSQGVQESRNEGFKKSESIIRENTVVKNVKDLFNSFLLSSDPVITNKRMLLKKTIYPCLKQRIIRLIRVTTYIDVL